MGLIRSYAIAPYGYGPEFADTERPLQYCSKLINRFINPAGAAEVRRGLEQKGATIANVSAPDLKSLHELIFPLGTAKLMVAGSAAGKMRIWALDTSVESTWTQRYASAATSAKFQSVQFDDKAIFVNGADRNLYTTDGSAFRELFPLIEQVEQETTASSQDRIKSTDIFGSAKPIVDWIAGTNILVNDLVFDATTSAAALITQVLTSSVEHQPLSAASPGIMSGNAAKAGGDRLEIRDLVELNVIPMASQDPDNVALAGNGTSATKTQVSAVGGRVNFANTQTKVGDFLNNTTRNRIGRITKVSGNELTHSSIAAQTSGDSLTFHKYAMPIASRAHVHYGRAYYVDARDRTKIRISGPNDPQDMTTDAGTLDSATFKSGGQSPGGDVVVGMGTFQKFFVFAGKRYVAMFSGISPIQDISTNTSDFKPESFFPQGLVSPDSLLTIGNDIVFLTPDGMQSATLAGAETLPTRQNLSDAMRSEIVAELDEIDAGKVLLVNYPRRNWVIAKVSSRLYCFNYSPNLGIQARGEGDVNQPGTRGSWHVIEGRMARMNDYFVRHDGNLVCCDSSGRVFEFDSADVYTDGGSALGTYTWRYQTAHLGMDEANKGLGRPSRRQKKGVSFMPTIQTSVQTTYQIRASAPYSQESGEFVTKVIDGSAVPVQTPKIPLTWRGERVRIDLQGTAMGYDALTHYSIQYNAYGTR